MNYEPRFCPKLRAIDVVPVQWEGKEAFVLRDPLGFSEGHLVVPKALGPILAALDGRHSLRDLQVMASRLFGRLVMLEEIENFVATLDQHFFLEGERFEGLKEKITAEFIKSPLRSPSHAGLSYPAEREKLENFLAEILARWPERNSYAPRVIIAPHIDLTAGAQGFAAAYKSLSWPKGARVVVLGTGHFIESPLSLLDKDFETPLGQIPCDRSLVETVLKEEPSLKGDLLGHRNEHSIEFQVLFLKYLLDEFQLVPILLASPTPETKGYFDEAASLLRELIDENTYFVVGVDFCHLGLRYGDQNPAGETAKKEALQFDYQILQKVLAQNAEALYELLSGEGESFKVCGFGPLYFLLRLLEDRPLEGKILHQEVVDFGPGSIVSFAAAALYDK